MHSTSNDKLARLAGLLYLVLLPTCGPAVFGGQFVMEGDPAGTLDRVQASRTFLELGIVAGAVGFVDWLVLGLVLHRLFSPVSKPAANLLVVFIAASTPLFLAALARRMDVLSLLNESQTLLALSGDSLRAQAMLALRSSENLILVAIIFWGLWLFPLGWLVYRSAFVPRVLGVLLILGVPFYVLIFIGTVIDAGYADTLFARIVGFGLGIPSVIGELGTCLWLLIRGARGRASEPATLPVP